MLPDVEVAGLAWHKSRRCESHACVEVAETSGRQMAMRNSTAPDRHIVFGPPAWLVFINAVRAGTFDLD